MLPESRTRLFVPDIHGYGTKCPSPEGSRHGPCPQAFRV